MLNDKIYAIWLFTGVPISAPSTTKTNRLNRSHICVCQTKILTAGLQQWVQNHNIHQENAYGGIFIAQNWPQNKMENVNFTFDYSNFVQCTMYAQSAHKFDL